MEARFHLSFFVADLETTRQFFQGVLGCRAGAAHAGAMDISFFGHQLTCHADSARVRHADKDSLDGNHFGAIIDTAEFHRVCQRLQASDVRFIVVPTIQNEGTPRERWKTVFLDPSGNAIELKCYRDQSTIFSAQ